MMILDPQGFPMQNLVGKILKNAWGSHSMIVQPGKSLSSHYQERSLNVDLPT
jgi:hypothetical protein